MNYVKLGKTGLTVSRLCFGALVMGPLQVNMTPQEGGKVIAAALEGGVNFIDTADLYGTYPHIREAIRLTGIDPVIATKSYAYEKTKAERDFEKARHQLDRDVMDIFLLHEQESKYTLMGHREALEFYLDMKAKGKIKAVGVSTHNVEVVSECARMDEIDVIHPLINMKGLGIGDGTIEMMLEAVREAYDRGKGIYSMKALGGGNLLASYQEAMKFVLDLPFVHSIAVGMQSIEEVEFNIRFFNGEDIPQDLKKKLDSKKRKLHIDYWCSGCGKCVKRCKQGALRIENGKARVDHSKCCLCGYCSSACTEMFAIKVT